MHASRPHLLEWWRPLILASRAVRLAEFPWPINIDELILVRRVDRQGRPSIWVYRHPEARGELYLDSTGQAYRYTTTPRARSHGRFNRCEIRTAMWRSGLPDVVEPIWFHDPGPRPGVWSAAWDHGDVGPIDPPPEPEPREPEPRRRGHLTVYEGGGRPLAG